MSGVSRLARYCRRQALGAARGRWPALGALKRLASTLADAATTTIAPKNHRQWLPQPFTFLPSSGTTKIGYEAQRYTNSKT